MLHSRLSDGRFSSGSLPLLYRHFDTCCASARSPTHTYRMRRYMRHAHAYTHLPRLHMTSHPHHSSATFLAHCAAPAFAFSTPASRTRATAPYCYTWRTPRMPAGCAAYYARCLCTAFMARYAHALHHVHAHTRAHYTRTPALHIFPILFSDASRL